MGKDLCECDSSAKTGERSRSHPDDDLFDLFSKLCGHFERTLNESRQRLTMLRRTIVTASKEWNRAIEEAH
jgi:hypothetical protein